VAGAPESKEDDEAEEAAAREGGREELVLLRVTRFAYGEGGRREEGECQSQSSGHVFN